MTTVIVNTAVSVTKIINNPPDIIPRTVIASVLQDTNIAGALSANANFGFNASVDDYYRYGRDYFVNGLGVGRQLNNKSFDEIRADILIALQSDDPNVTSVFFLQVDQVSASNLLIDILERDSQYSLSYLPQFSLSGETIPDAPIFVKVIATGQIYFIPFTTNLDFSGFTLTASIPVGLDQDQNIPPLLINKIVDYAQEGTLAFNVIYTVSDGAIASFGMQSYRRWVYSPITGIYPNLDQYAAVNLGRFFYPIAPVRTNNLNLVDEDFSNTALKKSTTKLLAKIGIDLDEFSDQIVDPNDPTALDDVDHMFLMFAMDLNSSEDIAKNYMYEFFRSAYYTQFADQTAWFSTSTAPRPVTRNTYVISGGRSNIQLMWNYISIEVKSGNVGDPHPGIDTSVIVPTSSIGNPIDPNNTGGADVNVQVVLGTEDFFDDAQFPFYNDHLVIYRKQLTTGVGATFVELVVHGLQHNIQVHTDAPVIHRSPGDMSDGGFFVPVSRDIVRQFSGVNESNIFFESLILVAYAIDETKLTWYQDPEFIKLVVFVIIIISIITFDYGTLGEALAGGATAFLEYVAKAYIISLLVGEGLSLLVDLLGPEYALILAAIATGVALSFGGDGTAVFGDLVNAEQLLQLATLTIQITNTEIEDRILELEEQKELFEKEIEDRQEELEDAQASLDIGVDIELYTLITPVGYTNFTEDPDRFFNRSIEETNPGVLSLEVIDNFVNDAFILPQGLLN